MATQTMHTPTAGSAIRVMRQAQGLTLRQLASGVGTSPSYLAAVERDDRTPSTRWMRRTLRGLALNLRSAA